MMKAALLAPLVLLCLSTQLSGGEAAFSRAMRCPCAASLGTADGALTIEQAVRVSDVVLLGRVVGLHTGLRGTMNASLISIFTYKGAGDFLTRVEDVTNFAKEAGEDVLALFFLAEEPAGNLALLCMSPLLQLNSATLGDLRSLLDFVRDMGRRKSSRKSSACGQSCANSCDFGIRVG